MGMTFREAEVQKTLIPLILNLTRVIFQWHHRPTALHVLRRMLASNTYERWFVVLALIPILTCHPLSNFERVRRYSPRRRMHSATAYASCTMCNVTEPLRTVTEALRNSYAKYRFCQSLIKF